MSEHDAFLALVPAVVLLAAGLVSIALARLTRVSAIVGFVLAGVVLGPSALNLVRPNETTALLAELGVVFLLFEIGLHFSVSQLRKNPMDVLALAPLQALLCVLAFGGAAYWLGLAAPAAVAIGGALAISSTAVVMATLSERNLRSCPLGRSATTVLIMQDILAIFLLTYGASMRGEAIGMAMALGLAALKALVGFVLVFTLGPVLLNPTFQFLARTRNQEAFTACALLLTLTLAAASAAAGLSLTLGGFLAGMMIGATRYRHVIETEAKPFRGLLLGFFFVSVGLQVDLDFLLANAWAVLALTLGLMSLKTVLNVAAALASRWSVPGALQFGFLLAQGSEFAFVILALPGVAGALAPQQSSLLIAAIAASLALTGPWSALGLALARAAAKRRTSTMQSPGAQTALEPDGAGEEPRALVVGIGPVGRRCADALQRFAIPFVAVEMDPERFNAAVADGYQVAFGAPGDLRFMQTIGAMNAEVLALTTPRFEISRAVSPAVADMFPKLVRLVAVDSEADGVRHAALGMTPVLNRSMPVGLDFASALLAALELSAEDIGQWRREEIERGRLDALAFEETFPSVGEPEAA